MTDAPQGRMPHRWQPLVAVVSMLDQPAAIVQSGAAILAHNAAWDRLAAALADDGHAVSGAIAHRPASQAAPEESSAFGRCLGDGRDAHALADTLAAGTPEHGSAELSLRGTVRTARWATLDPAANAALIVIDGADAPSEHQAGVIAGQRARIEQLLIRQTIIEEAERRRLGRALHDVVAQDLARVRAAITEGDRGGPSISGLCRDGGLAHGGVGDGALSGASAAGASSAVVALLDRVIEQIRTLAFELSPPVLDDLGLLAAARWLAEHLGMRYGTPIEVADDGREPPLDAPTRTVAFRVLRELVVNAARHAPGSDILISCETGSRRVRMIVRDNGPGFDAQAAERGHFGLMSVREQVGGLGGTFELVSAPDQGTRATVTLPLVDDPTATNPSEGVDLG